MEENGRVSGYDDEKKPSDGSKYFPYRLSRDKWAIWPIEKISDVLICYLYAGGAMRLICDCFHGFSFCFAAADILFEKFTKSGHNFFICLNCPISTE